MRIALYLTFLLSLFFAASALHHRWISQNRAETSQRLLTVGTRPAEGWARVVIGRPSAAEPIEWHPTDEPARYLDPEEEQVFEVEEESFEELVPLREQDIELTLDAGQTLSELCHQVYGTASPNVYQRLAEYNGLGSADAIRAGQALRLPANLDDLMNP